MKILPATGLLCLCTLFSTLFSAHSWSELPAPKGNVVLEVYGNIKAFNEDDVAAFDRAMIDQLPVHTIQTDNHVTEGLQTYKGPRLSDLLDQLGATGSIVRVYALDDYVAELSLKEVVKYKVILATEENGKALTIKDKGPFFVVFPFHEHPELRDDSHYSQSVWQVRAIEVE